VYADILTMIKSLSALLRNVFRKLRRSVELNKYDDFTIAEYFRKQGAVVGDDTRIEVRTLGAEPYLVKIGNHCTIAPNVSFLCHDGAAWIFTDEIPSMQKFGTIEIRDNCFIGMNAILIGNNITVGPNAIVGAGAVVTKDVPEGAVVAGNPARVVSTIDKFKEKALRRWEGQRPSGYFADLADGVKYDPAYIQKIKTREMHKLREHLMEVCWEKRGTDGSSSSPQKGLGE
jgi:acetyltransferase-like isoleucine patch superfamily enzyme